MAHKTNSMTRAWCIALFCSVAVLLTGCGSGNAPAETNVETPKAPATEMVTINDRAFELELALDHDSREQGLSDRKEIAKDGGMLFVFTRPTRGNFVMRRCYVPIDLIYVDRKGYVDSVHEMQVVEPIGSDAWHNPYKTYNSAGNIMYVIELKGGTLDELGVKRGDKIDLPFESLQSRAQ